MNAVKHYTLRYLQILLFVSVVYFIMSMILDEPFHTVEWYARRVAAWTVFYVAFDVLWWAMITRNIPAELRTRRSPKED